MIEREKRERLTAQMCEEERVPDSEAEETALLMSTAREYASSGNVEL